MIFLYLMLFVLLYLAFLIKTTKFENFILYSYKRLKKVKKTFSFSKNLVFKNEKNIKFYAEIENGFYLIFGKNSWVRVKINSLGDMQFFNKNNSFLRAIYSQNGNEYYYVDKVHTFVNIKSEISVFVKNVGFVWGKGKNSFNFSFKGKCYVLKFNGDMVFKKSEKNAFNFNCKTCEINYKSFGFQKIDGDEKKIFLIDNFGFLDTGKWNNVEKFHKVFNDENSLEKRYFNNLLKAKPTVKSLFELKVDMFISLEIKSYFSLLPTKNVKINLTEFGFLDVVYLERHKKFFCVCCLKTGYKMFLRFGDELKNVYLGRAFSDLFCFIELKKPCFMEFLPFSLMFEQKNFVVSSILELKTKCIPLKKLLTSRQTLSFERVLELLNIQILQGNYVDVKGILAQLNIKQLGAISGFKLANLLLSFSVVFGVPIQSYDLKNLLLNSLHNLNIFKKSEVFCYLTKLCLVIKDENIKNFINSLLFQYDCYDLNNFEYVFRFVLGIRLENNMFFVSQAQIEYEAKLLIDNNEISVSTSDRDLVFINGIEYVNKKGVDLKQIENKRITIKCARKI